LKCRSGNDRTSAPDQPGADAEVAIRACRSVQSLLAISQRPLAGVALTEAAPTPAWRSRPVWAVLPTADRCIDPGVHHFSYERMGATVTEIEGASDVVMISHPKEVAEVVMTAARTCAVRSA
jgi:hypothetical protein